MIKHASNGIKLTLETRRNDKHWWVKLLFYIKHQLILESVEWIISLEILGFGWVEWYEWVSVAHSQFYTTGCARKLHVNIMAIIPSTLNSFPELGPISLSMVCISWPTLYLEAVSSLLVGVCVTVIAMLTLQHVAGGCAKRGGGEMSESRSDCWRNRTQQMVSEWMRGWICIAHDRYGRTSITRTSRRSSRRLKQSER